MRKNIIALMLVLPILFVLVVYSAVNAASLDVEISVNGIEIMERYPSDTVSIDLADYDGSYEITPSVKPSNASNRQFEYRYERISGSATEEEVSSGKVVEVQRFEDGIDRIVAHSVGTVRIVAVSKDGGYEDSVTAIVGASKPYDFDFSVFGKGDSEKTNLLLDTDGVYTATLPAGQYGFNVKLKPNSHLSPTFKVEEGFMEADAARGSISLPFTGKTVFTVTIPNAVGGVLERKVQLQVVNQDLENNFSVNGLTDNNISIRFDRDSHKAKFYIEAAEEPTVNAYEEGVGVEVTRVANTSNGWLVSIAVPAEGEEFTFDVIYGGKTKKVTATAAEFDFTIRTDIPNFDVSAGTNILKGMPISFYAEPIEVATGISYKWDFINVGDMANLKYETFEDGAVCTVTANAHDKFIIVVEALRDGNPISNVDAHEVEVEVINNVVGITGIDTQLGLAKNRAVPGWKYENGQKTENIFPINVTARDPSGILEDGIYDLDFSVDSRAADLVKGEDGNVLIEDGCIFLKITGKDNINITAAWKGNEEWLSEGDYIEEKIALTVDSNAVEVTTGSQFFAEAEAGNPIVLGADIMLGADDNGEALPLSTRQAMLKTMRSTYNTDFYKKSGYPEDYASVNYVVEFKADLYGNGHSVCGEYFSNAQDVTGQPTLFKGPLNLVKLGEMASVAAQDNIVYLCRTDGVTLYNAVLLGCSDDSRINPETQVDDLTRLTYTGTVLDINADVNVLNCRVRNGRNVIRVYGGNRNGNNYFIDSLSENRLTAQDRAVVRIEGCILSHSREFVLKTGANRALRATVRLGREPYFTDRSGKNYESCNDNYLNDDYFYQTYVMTDVTLSDSVLEKSGLFCVGLETNFAGEMLYEGSRFAADETFAELFGPWSGVGGTSFATVLRLEGNVRMYDWKDLKNVNSDTLIQAGSQELPLKLDLASLIDYMCSKEQSISDIIDVENDVKYVHGGIALYGGGRNYSQISISGLSEERKAGLKEFRINISELEGAEGNNGGIGRYLPLAAGTQDFRFFMYSSASANNRQWQTSADYSVGGVPFNN